MNAFFYLKNFIHIWYFPTNSATTLSIVNQISTCKVLLELQVVNNLIANSLKLMVTFSVVNKLSKFIVLDMTQIIP
jgi:hypothetical protein